MKTTNRHIKQQGVRQVALAAANPNSTAWQALADESRYLRKYLKRDEWERFVEDFLKGCTHRERLTIVRRCHRWVMGHLFLEWTYEELAVVASEIHESIVAENHRSVTT